MVYSVEINVLPQMITDEISKSLYGFFSMKLNPVFLSLSLRLYYKVHRPVSRRVRVFFYFDQSAIESWIKEEK